MNDTDKTREKLVETMRRTKAEAASAPRKKIAATKRQAAKPRVSREPSSSGNGTEKKASRAVDPYQSARRVWPD